MVEQIITAFYCVILTKLYKYVILDISPIERGNIMYSIGGYKLRNFKEIQIGDYKAYTTDLHHNNRLIAKLEDKGEGKGMHVVLISQHRSVRKNEFDYILEDMKLLIQKLGKTIKQDAFLNTCTTTIHMSAVGFTELLVDLRGIYEQYELGKQKGTEGKHLAVGATGGSWFTTEGSDIETIPFHFDTKAATYKTALKRTKEHLAKNKELGELRALALLKGDFDWNLSFEDYSNLYTPDLENTK